MPRFLEATVSDEEIAREAQRDPAFDTPQQPLWDDNTIALFVSASRLYRQVRIPADDIPTAMGRRRVKGLSYQFENGYFRVTKQTHKQDARFFEELRERVGDKLFQHEDTRPAEEWLRDQPNFGVVYHEITRPEVQAPDPVWSELARLSAVGDEEGLALLWKNSEARPDVQEAAMEALRALETAKTVEGPPEVPGGDGSPEAA